ncbi:MAG: hypothetical protein ACTSP4_09370 [Candidatus Hodarchaeales archaeon]
MADVLFYTAQTGVLWLSCLINIIIAVIVYTRDRTFTLNRVFSLAVLNIGLFNFFMGASNIPVILTESQVIILAVQLAYVFLVIGLSVYVLSALILRYGEDRVYKNSILLSMVLFIAVNTVMIFLPGSIVTTEVVGDIVTGIFFKLVTYSSLVILFILSYYLFFRTYKETSGGVKNNIRWFLIGWTVGGIALVLNVLSDFYILFDLIGPAVLTIAIILQLQGFRGKE